MTKAELIAKMSEKAGVSKIQAERTLDAFVDALTEALSKGERIAIPKFGVFNVRERAARTGRNPRTGERIQIPAKKIVKFSTSKFLEDAIND